MHSVSTTPPRSLFSFNGISESLFIPLLMQQFPNDYNHLLKTTHSFCPVIDAFHVMQHPGNKLVALQQL